MDSKNVNPIVYTAAPAMPGEVRLEASKTCPSGICAATASIYNTVDKRA